MFYLNFPSFQEVLGVQSKTERDPVLLEKERPPNDCPTQ